MCEAIDRESTYFLPDGAEADWTMPGEAEHAPHRYILTKRQITKGQVACRRQDGQPVHRCR